MNPKNKRPVASDKPEQTNGISNLQGKLQEAQKTITTPPKLSRSDAFKSFIETHKEQFEIVAPKTIDFERIFKLAVSACKRTPELLNCEFSTIAGGLLEGISLGLEVNSPMHEASLVPFKNNKTKQTEAQLIIEYRGYIKLFYQHSSVVSIFASVVRQKDHFDYMYGIDEKLEHRPSTNRDPGDIVYVYAYAKLIDGFRFVVLPKAKVDRVRDMFSKSYARDPKNSPWNTDYPAMAEKTAIRALERWTPKSSTASRATDADMQAFKLEDLESRNLLLSHNK